MEHNGCETSWRTHYDFRVAPRQRLRRGGVQSEFLPHVYSRLGKHTRAVHRTKCARRTGTYVWQRWRTRRQSRQRCNSQEGSKAERLSVEVACRSNGRRETGGIKLLQTITFNEKVNATSRGLARTWMQMCRRRVISKQTSPPTYRLLFLLLLLIFHIAVAFLPWQRIGPRETKPPLPFCWIAVYVYVNTWNIWNTLSLSDIPSTIDRFLGIENEHLSM